MKLINNRGRILLEVTRQYRDHVNTVSKFDYVTPGSGAGSSVSMTNVIQAIDFLKMDHASARIEGFFPQVELLCKCAEADRPCPPNPYWASKL